MRQYRVRCGAWEHPQRWPPWPDSSPAMRPPSSPAPSCAWTAACPCDPPCPLSLYPVPPVQNVQKAVPVWGEWRQPRLFPVVNGQRDCVPSTPFLSLLRRSPCSTSLACVVEVPLACPPLLAPRARCSRSGSRMGDKVAFRVVYASSEDPQYPASELNIHSAKVRGVGVRVRGGV